ncbi:alpha-galactosidase [Cellulosilyticum lentocellum]|uniref:Glycoside hydrolase clan GH-D n=1 Tax=Cellulosilyticum lentocellum (strain ATCC 49066 / DSM 5427 / NCIMB 11756 / RHM5) TaxID=642492 RepID=F2JR75_CELLD|nr:alpha-galactosidase [Cellulosilyticum lentocellum]ADZ85056.1 glycoside hydrolase clan GH-D [Cellulosilyticum lentocellum DSM 5427]
MKRIEVVENGIYMVLEITKEEQVKLLHFSAIPFNEMDIVSERIHNEAFNLVELNLSGMDKPYERHGNKYIVTAPGYRMKYSSLKDERNALGRKIEITTYDEVSQVYVTTHMQFYNQISIVRFWNEVTNKGKNPQTLEYISSFNYTGIEKEGLLPRDEKMRIHVPHHSWQREMNWQTYTLPEVGLEQVQPTIDQRSSNAFEITNVGNWSSKKYLPMGYLENTEVGSSLFWQIEHNGSWHWEIGDQNGHFYLNICGPDELNAHWFKELGLGDTFTSVPVAVGVTSQGFDEAIGQLTRYRRVIRRPNKDNEELKIIFNDYMNSLWGDPTTEKEIPLIDAAAKAGCEYYCIDAGWYADGNWWDNVGEWQESKQRFPNGLKEVTDYIRKKGMIPGAWLELEVMGINCPKLKELDDTWFFIRHGKRVYDRSRYQLDFRNEKVRNYATEVIDRLINEYGIGYIKMDYNIEPGIGTEYEADSVGDGLLEHQRAYLAWLDCIFEKYPELIIENCSSGGLRMDYAMLARYSIQSTSDQENYLQYATIAANAPTGVTPEQAAIWSYPLEEGDKEEVVFNMVNSLLLRIHQSGHLARLSKERGSLVKEALDYYKTIRQDIKIATPFWPLGLSHFKDEWVCLGMKTEHKLYIAVWRRQGNKTTKEIPLIGLVNNKVSIKCTYPSYASNQFEWQEASQKLTITLEPNTARLFEIEKE